MGTQADGFRHRQVAVGASSLHVARVPGAGHFTQVEAPDATWHRIAAFAGRWQAL